MSYYSGINLVIMAVQALRSTHTISSLVVAIVSQCRGRGNIVLL